MEDSKIRSGMEIKTKFNPQGVPEGLQTAPEDFLGARKNESEGSVMGRLKEHNKGDAWWVMHNDGSSAVYTAAELRPK